MPSLQRGKLTISPCLLQLFQSRRINSKSTVRVLVLIMAVWSFLFNISRWFELTIQNCVATRYLPNIYYVQKICSETISHKLFPWLSPRNSWLGRSTPSTTVMGHIASSCFSCPSSLSSTSTSGLFSLLGNQAEHWEDVSSLEDP